jgi:hypothetical protein
MGTEGGSQAADRVVDVLEVLAHSPTPLSTTEIAVALGVHRSIVHRFLKTLTRRKLVLRVDGGYTLGFGLMTLAEAVSHDLQSVAQPELSDLANRAQVSVFMYAWDGEDAHCLLFAEPRDAAIRLSLRLGPLREGVRFLTKVPVAVLAGRPAQPDEVAEVTAARAAGYTVTSHKSGQFSGIDSVTGPIGTPQGTLPMVLGMLYVAGSRNPEEVGPELVASAARLADIFADSAVSLPRAANAHTFLTQHAQ